MRFGKPKDEGKKKIKNKTHITLGKNRGETNRPSIKTPLRTPCRHALHVRMHEYKSLPPCEQSQPGVGQEQVLGHAVTVPVVKIVVVSVLGTGHVEGRTVTVVTVNPLDRAKPDKRTRRGLTYQVYWH